MQEQPHPAQTVETPMFRNQPGPDLFNFPRFGVSHDNWLLTGFSRDRGESKHEVLRAFIPGNKRRFFGQPGPRVRRQIALDALAKFVS
jgi:hypothetical protein